MGILPLTYLYSPDAAISRSRSPFYEIWMQRASAISRTQYTIHRITGQGRSFPDPVTHTHTHAHALERENLEKSKRFLVLLIHPTERHAPSLFLPIKTPLANAPTHQHHQIVGLLLNLLPPPPSPSLEFSLPSALPAPPCPCPCPPILPCSFVGSLLSVACLFSGGGPMLLFIS